MSDDTSAVGRSGRGGVVAQVVLVMGVAFAVQLLLPFRGDSTAHVMGGAALTMAAGALVPSALIRRAAGRVEAAVFALVVAVAWVAEMTVLGPFDLLDVTFGAAGSFVALAALPRWSDLDRAGRVRLGRVAAGLMALAALWRYGVRIGH